MVDSAATLPGCACTVDAGRCPPKVDSGSATDALGGGRARAAGRVQTGAGVVESTISGAAIVGARSDGQYRVTEEADPAHRARAARESPLHVRDQDLLPPSPGRGRGRR